MCGRFSVAKKAEDIEERFNAKMDKSYFRAVYNAAPSQRLPVITNEDSHSVSFFRWGLVPFWAKNISIGNKLINARAETLVEKPAFRAALKKKRCLVIADGFYEWMKTKEEKIPYRIVLKDNVLFAFAGLWDEWIDTEGKSLFSFTIITTTPNALMQTIHTRMPVILTKDAEQTWLNTSSDMSDALEALKPYSSELMQAYPVSKAVNSTMHNEPDVMVSVK